MNAKKSKTEQSTPRGLVVARSVAAGSMIAAMLLFAAGASAATSNSPASAVGAVTATAPSAAMAPQAGRVDVNRASPAELASLPGIGPSKAEAIIAEREKKPFTSVDDLERVRGIGARTVEDLREKVTVGSN